MAEREGYSGIEIGEVLKSTRARRGLDVRTVEDRTKIRTKYIRALENEEWEVLPSTAYAKGFLRSYADLLGLDADALVDEYRRQVEAGAPSASPVGESVLERRRRLDDPSEGPGLGRWLGAAVAALVVVLLVIGLTAGGEDGSERERGERGEAREARLAERRRGRREAAGAGEAMRLRLTTSEAVHLCLVGDGERSLIDGQVLPAGTEDSFEAARFLISFPSGYQPDQLVLRVDGAPIALPERRGAAAFRLVDGDLRNAPRPGPGCP